MLDRPRKGMPGITTSLFLYPLITVLGNCCVSREKKHFCWKDGMEPQAVLIFCCLWMIRLVGNTRGYRQCLCFRSLKPKIESWPRGIPRSTKSISKRLCLTFRHCRWFQKGIKETNLCYVDFSRGLRRELRREFDTLWHHKLLNVFTLILFLALVLFPWLQLESTILIIFCLPSHHHASLSTICWLSLYQVIGRESSCRNTANSNTKQNKIYTVSPHASMNHPIAAKLDQRHDAEWQSYYSSSKFFFHC